MKKLRTNQHRANPRDLASNERVSTALTDDQLRAVVGGAGIIPKIEYGGTEG